MPTLFLTGQIKPLQPIVINIPAGQRDRVPNKHVYIQPIYTDAGQRVLLPCITGSNIKGALRGAGGVPALCEVYGATPGKPETFGVLTIPQHYNASSGGLVDVGPQTADDLVEMRHNRYRDLQTFLFGSMRLGVKGALQVDFATPDPVHVPGSVKDILGRVQGARRDPYRTDPSLLTRHSDEEIERFLGRLDSNKDLSKLRSERKKIEASIQKIQRKRDEATEAEKLSMEKLTADMEDLRKKERAKQEEGAESIGRTLDGVDYIPAGLPLNHEIRLVNTTDEALGYFLQVLRHFSLQFRLGARETTGFGQISMEYRMRINDGGFSLADAGTLRVSPFDFAMETDHPVFDRAAAAFEVARKDPARHFALDLGTGARKEA